MRINLFVSFRCYILLLLLLQDLSTVVVPETKLLQTMGERERKRTVLRPWGRIRRRSFCATSAQHGLHPAAIFRSKVMPMVSVDVGHDVDYLSCRCGLLAGWSRLQAVHNSYQYSFAYRPITPNASRTSTDCLLSCFLYVLSPGRAGVFCDRALRRHGGMDLAAV